jgi:hypothetical protein
MNPSVIPAPQSRQKRRVLSARRIILLATTIASLGAAALVIAPGLNLPNGYPAALAQNLSEQAHKLQAPIGFADIVEKVKPAVISVRVKVDGGSQSNGLSNRSLDDIPPGLQEFFRRGKHFRLQSYRSQKSSNAVAHGSVVINDKNCGAGIVRGHLGTSYDATGIVKWNIAPSGIRGSAHKRPPWDSTRERLMDKPMPMPCDLVVKNGSKIRSAISWLIPIPLSSTETSTSVAFCRREIIRISLW